MKSLQTGNVRRFTLWWLLTFVLGAIFLAGTAQEWHHLIYDEGLTIQTNLFGTTYYSLVGLHAFHVTVGLLALAIVSLFTILGHIRQEHAERAAVLSMYWHFVDVVWVVVFIVVYIVDAKERNRMADEFNPNGAAQPNTVQMPAPTAWPIVLAFGIALLFGGLVTSEAVSMLGAILSLVAAVGWFRDVLRTRRMNPCR